MLYELLTGKPPFQGEDVTETLAAVVKEKPDLSVLPARVRRLIERCIEKDPKKRLRDIGDAWGLVDTQTVTESPQRKPHVFWPVVAVLATVTALFVSFAHFREKPSPVAKPIRFQIYPPEKGNFGSYTFSSLDLSHDGRRLAFIATGQDVANVAESSAAFVFAEVLPNGDYYYSVTVPALIVATYGGGTGLATQRECLELLGCYGKGKVHKFAEIVAATVLCGELSLGSAIVAEEWVEAHDLFGRNRP